MSAYVDLQVERLTAAIFAAYFANSGSVLEPSAAARQLDCNTCLISYTGRPANDADLGPGFRDPVHVLTESERVYSLWASGTGMLARTHLRLGCAVTGRAI